MSNFRGEITVHDEVVAALAAGEKTVPQEVAEKIWDGQNPIRVWREYRGINGTKLAELAGIKQGYLSEIETGKKDGTIKTLTAIARALDVGLDDLVPPNFATD